MKSQIEDNDTIEVKKQNVAADQSLGKNFALCSTD
jgi:hypothetical protein